MIMREIADVSNTPIRIASRFQVAAAKTTVLIDKEGLGSMSKTPSIFKALNKASFFADVFD